MFRPVLLTIFLFLSFYTHAQQLLITGQVTDKRSNIGLSYVNIMMLNHSLGTTSDYEGFFELLVDSSFINDTVIFSYIGYKSEYLKIKKLLNNKIIKLTPTYYLLDEITIKQNSYTNNKDLVLNKFKPKQCFLRYSICPFDSTGTILIPYRPNEPTIEAAYFKYNNDFNKIYEIQVYLSNMKQSPSKIRLRIFNNINNKPGFDLVAPKIISVNKNKQLIKINLKDDNIRMNKGGVYVGCEALFIDENIRKYTNNRGDSVISYEPFLYLVRSDKIGDYWFYSKGKWIMSKYWYFSKGIWFMSDKNNLKGKYISKPFVFKPAISILLSN